MRPGKAVKGSVFQAAHYKSLTLSTFAASDLRTIQLFSFAAIEEPQVLVQLFAGFEQLASPVRMGELGDGVRRVVIYGTHRKRTNSKQLHDFTLYTYTAYYCIDL